jgi:Reverse transcriptase (RNA-dependent DNA polymerase)
LETILINKVTSVGACDKHQFRFKAGHSTGHCTNAVKKVVEYYTDHDSHVFACFVDFSTAFDSVDYWKLFIKLLDDDTDSDTVAVLAVWYSEQEICIQWKNVFSSKFSIGNGT